MTEADTAERMANAEAARAILAGNALAFQELEAQLTANLVKAAKQGRQDKATDLLGMALKSLDNLQSYFTAIVADGDVAKHAAEHVADLTRMSAEERRFASY